MSASTGGACGDGWCCEEDTYLDLNAKELRYLIHQRVGRDEYFKVRSMKEINVDYALSNLAVEYGEPDGGPVATVNSVIPEELETLFEEIQKVDTSNDEELETIREKISKISDGEYTFYFTVTDADVCYYFSEHAEAKISLTAEEAIGLLFGEFQDDEIFEGLCSEVYDEDFINDLAEQEEVADEYNTFSYSGSCDQLEIYLKSWEIFFNRIDDGTINKNNVDNWLEYFNENNFEEDIENWYKSYSNQ